MDSLETAGTSPKSRAAALALCIVLGVFGAHRFFVGKVGTGILQLCTLGGVGLWWLYDLILISAGSFRDGDDRPVVNWAEGVGSDPRTIPPDLTSKLRVMVEEMQLSRSELGELAERVDFLERVLTKVTGREGLPRSG